MDALGTNDDLGTIAGFHRMEMEEAGHLLDEALNWLRRQDHRFDCPRLRDDYDCTCGLSDLRARIVEWLTRASP